MRDSQQDALFREVEEDLRHEQLHRLWKQYGSTVIATAVMIVVVVAGQQGWKAWQARQHQADAQAFEAAIEKNDPDALAHVAGSAGKGTAAIAQLAQAKVLVQTGKVEEALKVYRSLSRATDLDPVWRNTATVQWGLLAMDHGVSLDEVQAAVASVATPGQPMEFSARQLLAAVAMQQGDGVKARALWAELSADANAPASLRERAKQVLTTLPAAPAS